MFHVFILSRSLLMHCHHLKKKSLREAILLTVNSTLFNFPFDRMAIFSSAKDTTVLKVEWVIKWKIVSWESHVGLSGGSLGHEAHAAMPF